MKRAKKPWSPSPYLKSHIRKIWRWSQARRDCLKSKTCFTCNKRKTKLYADHVDPVTDPLHGFVDWNTYIDRMFNGKLQALCSDCHSTKTKRENAERRRIKKENAKNVL